MSFTALKKRIAAIDKIIAQVAAARKLPDDREKMAKAVCLADYQRSHEGLVEAFKTIKVQFAAEERRQGEIARDRELKRLARELEILRADLPELATAARFELLGTIRDMAS